MWVSHVARISEHGTHTNKHYHTYDAYKWVMSHIQISNVTHMNESCIWMSHSEHISVSDHTYECVMSHTWMRQFADTNQPCHIWMSHSTHTNGSCRTYVPCHTLEWVIPHTCMSHVTHINESCTTHTRAHTHTHTPAHTHTHTHTHSNTYPRARANSCAARCESAHARHSNGLWRLHPSDWTMRLISSGGRVRA